MRTIDLDSPQDGSLLHVLLNHFDAQAQQIPPAEDSALCESFLRPLADIPYRPILISILSSPYSHLHTLISVFTVRTGIFSSISLCLLSSDPMRALESNLLLTAQIALPFSPRGS